ncbi:MAG: dockerin type I repeat-containing protein, partial [Ruminococcus sp.]|nr:dockerin type I repeat-containing protein [Ruminococcus sp.]
DIIATFTQIVGYTNMTGYNPADGISGGGLMINKEAYNQFRRNDSQLPNHYYTVDITADELALLKNYLADPNNNIYSLFNMSCATSTVNIWNTTLSDRPEHQIKGNLTGLANDPMSIYYEVGGLKYKSDLDGKGGDDFYPHIVVLAPSDGPVDPIPDDPEKPDEPNEPDAPILGDVDGDSEVTIVDATYIQRKLASIPIPFEFYDTVADEDKDGEVTIIDATFIQRWLANLPAPDGIGEPIDIEPVQPSETEHKLLSCVDTYQWDYEYDDWELSMTTTVKYENGYPVLFDMLENYDDAEHILTNITYTFDGDLPLTRTEVKESAKTTVEYSNGRVYNVNQEIVGSGSYAKQMYQYGHGDGYFTMVLHDTLREGNEWNPDVHMEEVDSVSITTENGLLKSTTNTGMYAYWSEKEEKKWIRFRGVYTNTYDTDGIVSLSTADLFSFGIQQQAKYEVIKDNGRIVEIVQYTFDGEGGWQPFTKYVFEYNDTEISAARYASMMNYFITNGGGNYYIFNWY